MNQPVFDAALLQPPHQSHKAFKIIASFAIAGIMLFVFYYTLFHFSGYDFTLPKNTRIITNWEYFIRDELYDDEQEKAQSYFVQNLAQIRKNGKGDFIYLNTQIPASPHNQSLVLQTFSNPVRVLIDNEKAFSNIEPTTQIGMGFVQDILIPSSAEDVHVQIIMQSAFLPKIQAYIVPEGYFGVPLTMFNLLWLILTVLFFIICVFIIVKETFQKSHLRKKELILVCLIETLLCIAVLVEFFDIYINDAASGGWLRFGMFLLMLAGMLMFYHMYHAHTTEGPFRFCLKIGFLYATIAFVCPYQPLFIQMLKYFGIFYFMMYLILLPVYLYRLRQVKPVVLSTTILMEVSYIIYWICYLISIPMAMPLLLLATILPQTAQALSIIEKPALPVILSSQNADLLRFKPDGSGPFDDVLDVFMQNKDNATHIRNVSLYTYAICRQSGMTRLDSETIAKAAFFHDIGKTRVSVKIVNKDGILSSAEYEQIKAHAQLGYDLLSSCKQPFYQLSAIIAQQHHERYDGKGYFGIAGDEIHYYAKIVCLADVFDALTTKRTYKNAWSFDESFDYIANHNGSMFDPKLVEIFLNCRERIYKIYCDTRT